MAIVNGQASVLSVFVYLFSNSLAFLHLWLGRH